MTENKNISFGKKIVFLFVAVLFGFFLVAISITIVGKAVSFDSSNIIHIKIRQIIASLGVFLIPAMLVNYYFYNQFKPVLPQYQSSKIKAETVFYTIFLIVSLLPFISIITYLNEQIPLPRIFSEIEKETMKLTEKLLTVKSFWELLGNIIVIALIPAIAEEYLFRGVLLKIFLEKSKNQHIAIWVVAGIFSFIHFQMAGFFPRMILGAVLGYLMVWSGSITLPMIAHFTNNTMAVIVFYFGGKEIDNIQNLATKERWALGIITIISLFVIYLIIKRLKNILKLKTEKSINS